MEFGYPTDLPTVSETPPDEYTASIELSNACRQFYKSRVEAAEYFKSKWGLGASSASGTNTTTTTNDNDRPKSEDVIVNTNSDGLISSSSRKQKNSIEKAMDKLRSEMMSLMDQDLSLMRQLLTLNETIEEIKYQRQYYHGRRSQPVSSLDLADSRMVWDSEMYDSGSEDDLHPHPALSPTSATTCTPSPKLSETLPRSSSSNPASASFSSSSSASPSQHQVSELARFSGHGTVPTSSSSSSCSEKRKTDSESHVRETSAGKGFHIEQNSFDSGIHDHSSEEETWI